MTIERRLLLAFIGAVAILTSGFGIALGEEIHTPAPGTPERKAILDALRPRIETEMRGPVEFVVNVMNVGGGWAFVSADPQRPGGAPIDPYETIHSSDVDYMDGLTVWALLRRSGGSWGLIASLTGPTDAGWVTWPDEYGVPASVLELR